MGDDTTTHMIFLVASGTATVFLLLMRWRLVRKYPDDESNQMLAMLGFLRGMLIFAILVFGLVLLDLSRLSLL
jgi:hypothetical protein